MATLEIGAGACSLWTFAGLGFRQAVCPNIFEHAAQVVAEFFWTGEDRGMENVGRLQPYSEV